MLKVAAREFPTKTAEEALKNLAAEFEESGYAYCGEKTFGPCSGIGEDGQKESIKFPKLALAYAKQRGVVLLYIVECAYEWSYKLVSVEKFEEIMRRARDPLQQMEFLEEPTSLVYHPKIKTNREKIDLLLLK